MPGSLGVGGSGAIMGVLGARIGEGLVKYHDRGGGIDDLCITGVSVGFVLMMSFVPFVDWPAHVGGAVSGLVVGLIAFSHDNLWGRYGCKVRGGTTNNCLGAHAGEKNTETKEERNVGTHILVTLSYREC